MNLVERDFSAIGADLVHCGEGGTVHQINPLWQKNFVQLSSRTDVDRRICLADFNSSVSVVTGILELLGALRYFPSNKLIALVTDPRSQ